MTEPSRQPDPATYEVVTAYTKQYPDPIVAARGERVAAGERDQWGDHGVWIWCTTAAGKAGWTPEAYLTIGGDQATLLRDYSAVELTVAAGERVTGYDRIAGWVWCENAAGEAGWVPVDNLRENRESAAIE